MLKIDIFSTEIKNKDYKKFNGIVFSSLNDTLNFVRDNLIDDIYNGLEVIINQYRMQLNSIYDKGNMDLIAYCKVDKYGNIHEYHVREDLDEYIESVCLDDNHRLYVGQSITNIPTNVGYTEKAKYVLDARYDKDEDVTVMYIFDAKFNSPAYSGDSDLDSSIYKLTGVHNMIVFHNKQVLANIVVKLQTALDMWTSNDDMDGDKLDERETK